MNPDEAVVVAVGGNLAGDFPSLQALLQAALVRLDAEGLPVARQSSWWRSAAWPDASQPEYRNAVIFVETERGPRETLQALLAVEQAFGRRRDEPNAPRTLDLDLIAHGRTVLAEPDLILPHPRAHERLFVMGPLAEIAPDWRHPVLNRTAAELAAAATVGLDATPLR
jgi:2-amino-4-hydroxy-6-hydroxymethyldihydropteridine diphosphokinase